MCMYSTQVMVLARYPNISPAGVWQFLLTGKVLNSQTSFVFNDSRYSYWVVECFVIHVASYILKLFYHSHCCCGPFVLWKSEHGIHNMQPIYCCYSFDFDYIIKLSVINVSMLCYTTVLELSGASVFTIPPSSLNP